MTKPEIREQIKYHIDKGITRLQLFDEMLMEYADTPSGDPPYNMDDVRTEFQAMVDDGTLTMGLLHGSAEFVVVTDWMPNSAQKIRDARKLNPA